MDSVLTLVGIGMGLFISGLLLNHLSQSLYWWWYDMRASKEDAKMLKEQQKTIEKLPDNVVKLDDRRKTTFILSNYNDDTIH